VEAILPSAGTPVASKEEGSPKPGIPRVNTNPDFDPYVKSQMHLLQATTNNPQPTAVPPPIAANAGTLGVRHVLCVIGLPERGKPYIARRLQAYLSFFHGADVQVFDMLDYQTGPSGCDENADALLADMRLFMGKANEAAGHNMNVHKAPARGGHLSRPASIQSEGSIDKEPESDVQSLLVDEKDARRKNVDSGKVCIIMSSDSHACFKEKWSGTSKERRQWASATLAGDKQMNAKLIFIEVIVNKPELVEANIRSKRRSAGEGETSAHSLREHTAKVKTYSRMYVTLQDDGSEDDLSYIKLYNYGGKVVTNRMHGYLRMRIAQFLTTVHTTPHVIYLSRHGQSEYNVLGKIGGNPPLSEAGKQYAEKLGAWVPKHICRTPSGVPIRTRLWTSSLQRTILTAEHIPHPIVPLAEFCNHGVVEMQDVDGSCPAAAVDITTPVAKETSKVAQGATFKSAIASGSSPPPEMQDVDTDGVWEQMAPRVYRNLDEIFAGEYEGMTYDDIKRLHSDEASLRQMDKIGYRYPRGESYFDILSRLDPLVHEMESYHEPLLIVSHQAVLRVLYSYLMGKPRTKAPKIEIPLHTVMKITYDGWNPPTEERFYLGPEPIAIDDTRPADDRDGQKHL